MATKYLTFDDALKAPACYDCGDSTATCSYCGESASKHTRDGDTLRNGEHVCDETGRGEFYAGEPVAVAYERPTWSSPGGYQFEDFCVECDSKREARAQRDEAARARARGEDC